MIAPKRPEPRTTLSELFPVPPADPAPTPPPPEPEPEPLEGDSELEGEDEDVLAALAREAGAKPKKRKKPKHNSGSIKDPYPCEDGSVKVKTALNFTEGFAQDFALFAAEYLRGSTKSAFAERVLQREINRTRKRGHAKP